MNPGDFLPIAGMVFSLLVVLIIGGLILMYPLTKRLAKLLEMWLEDRRGPGSAQLSAGAGDELAELRRAVDSMEGELARLVERQEFMERLLASGEKER